MGGAMIVNSRGNMLRGEVISSPPQRKLRPCGSMADLLRDHFLPLRMLAAGTVEQYSIAAGDFDRLVKQPPRNLSEQLLVKYAKLLVDGGLSVAAAKRRVGVIRTLWAEGYRQAFVRERVCDPLRLREPARSPQALDYEREMPRLLASCRAWNRSKYCPQVSPGWTAEHMEALGAVIYETGERIGALLKVLAADAINAARGELVVCAEVRKGRYEDRIYGITPATLQKLQRLPKHASGRLFPWTAKPQTLRAHWKKILAAADLPATRQHLFHCLRRTHLTTLAIKEGIEAARQSAGHSSIAVTMRYIDPRLYGRRRFCDLLPQVI